MAELVLSKIPSDYYFADRPHLETGEQVVGVTAPDGRTPMEFGYSISGQEKFEIFNLNAYAAIKFVEFFRRSRAADPETRPFYNCHLLAWYITGCISEFKSDLTFETDGITTPLRRPLLTPGKTYAIQTADGRLNHSMIGTNRPDYSVSILGDYSPLVVAHNEELLSLYDGAGIVETFPRSAH